MLFKGSFVTSASGSLGGITASSNRGGQYLRARLIPTDPISELQATRRAVFGEASAVWLQNLSESQRDAWDLYAENSPVTNSLGDPILLSGHQMFIRTETITKLIGVGQIVDAPTVFGLGPSTIIGQITLTPLTTNVVVPGIPADTTVIQYAGRPQNASVSFFRGPWRFVTSDTTSPVGGTNPWPAAVDQRQWVAHRQLNDDGRLSALTIGGPSVVVADP